MQHGFDCYLIGIGMGVCIGWLVCRAFTPEPVIPEPVVIQPKRSAKGLFVKADGSYTPKSKHYKPFSTPQL